MPFSAQSLSVTEECEVLIAVTITITAGTQYRPVETYVCFWWGGPSVFIYHKGMKKVASSTG